MAKLTQRVKGGRTVSIEIGEDESSEAAAKRLAQLVAQAGGPWKPKHYTKAPVQQAPTPVPPHLQLVEPERPSFEDMWTQRVLNFAHYARLVAELGNIRWCWYLAIASAQAGERQVQNAPELERSKGYALFVATCGNGGALAGIVLDPMIAPEGTVRPMGFRVLRPISYGSAQ